MKDIVQQLVQQNLEDYEQGKLDTVKMTGKSEKYNRTLMIGSIKMEKHGKF